MLEYLEIENAGPADHLRLDFAPRLNLLTGDNGLGKSFLLDVAWWVFAQTWPIEENPNLLTGHPVNPLNAEAKIKYKITSEKFETSIFDYYHGKWEERGAFIENDLIIYSKAGNDFCILNGIRHVQNRCLILEESEVWDGQIKGKSVTFNGLIRDLSFWQIENGLNFNIFKKSLEKISPIDDFLEPGRLTRINNDSRNIPTISSSFGNTPIIYASSGIRRIISLVYILIWTWQEHKTRMEIENFPAADQITLIIDELDAHLHPKWQRTIVRSLMEVMKVLAPEVKVQIIAATHSPLVMASVEPFFAPEQDAWFDLDLNRETGQVEVTKRSESWYRRGDADAWLKSEAFDQKSGYAPETEKLIERAGAALQTESLSREKALEIDAELRQYLAESDPFLKRWEYIAEKKGWLEE